MINPVLAEELAWHYIAERMWNDLWVLQLELKATGDAQTWKYITDGMTVDAMIAFEQYKEGKTPPEIDLTPDVTDEIQNYE